MCEITNYFERKGITIWNSKPGDVEGVKDKFYLNIIKNADGYMVIMSITGTPKFTYKQLNSIDETEIRHMYNRMKNKLDWYTDDGGATRWEFDNFWQSTKVYSN